MALSARTRIDIKRRPETLKFIRVSSRKIARSYVAATVESSVPIPDVDASEKADTATRTSPVPPRYRPINILKRDIYRLACDIDRRDAVELLIYQVERRDGAWNVRHRPGQATVIDWTVRLVRGALLGRPPAIGLKDPKFLFNSPAQTRLAVELNFAFRHGIHPELVSMFIDDLGGYAMISQAIARGSYDLRDQEWLAPLQRRRREMGEQAVSFYDEADDEELQLTTAEKRTASSANANDSGWN